MQTRMPLRPNPRNSLAHGNVTRALRTRGLGISRLPTGAGNAAAARWLDGVGKAVHRHTEEEAAEMEEEEAVQRKSTGSVVQRNGVRAPYADPIRERFTQRYEAGDKTGAVRILKDAYDLDTKPYTLTVVALPKASTHASTGGGWDAAGTTLNPVTVKVNETYIDAAVGDDGGYNKLLHTLSHEYQHVKQRNKKGWRTTNDASAKGLREFEAYSFEVLDARSQKGVPDLPNDKKIGTVGKAEKYYNTMSPALQKKHKGRMKKLRKVRTDAGG